MFHYFPLQVKVTVSITSQHCVKLHELKFALQRALYPVPDVRETAQDRNKF